MSARSFEVFGTRKRFGNVTIYRFEGLIEIELHNTVVVQYYTNSGEIILNSGGWQTITTKTCINEALKQIGINARVYQKDHVWYVYRIHNENDNIKVSDIEFTDFMKIK